MAVPTINNMLANSNETPPTPQRPILKPYRFVSRSVVIPPRKSAATFMSSGNPANTPSVVEVRPRAFSRYVGSYVMKK